MSGTAFELGALIELQTAVLRALPRTMSKSDMLAWANNGEKLERALASALCPLATPMPEFEPILDTLIRVDRSIRPVYPDWVRMVMHLELESTGPSQYDVATIALWLHDCQKNRGWGKGQVIYDYLKSNNMLESCLDLRDLEEIRRKGINFFRKHFAGKAVFAWKSVVQNRNGDLFVPCLVESGVGVVVDWRRLDDVWFGNYPAARFAS